MEFAEQIKIPIWLAYTLVATGGLVSLIEIIKFAISLLTIPTLNIKLTREVFFRLIDDGEGIFANGVLHSKNGTVEICDINFTLDKHSGATKKQVGIKVLLIGKKVNSNNTLASHYFYTTSPINYLSPEKTVRQLYCAVCEEKSGNMRTALSGYRYKLSELKRSLSIKYGEPIEQANYQAWLDEVQKEGIQLRNVYKDKIMENLELAPGKYTLNIETTYKPLHWLLKHLAFKRIASDSISFEIENDFRDSFKTELENYLNAHLVQVFEPQNSANYPLIWPEYKPVNVSES